jgi:hypothetical protein
VNIEKESPPVARVFCLLALLAVIAAGCDPASSTRKKLEGPKTPNWPAKQALQDEGGIITVGMGIQMEGPKAGAKAAAAPRFKELLDKFEKEPIPSAFSTPPREAAKKDLVENLRKMAAGGSDDEIKALWTKAQENLKALAAP